jgi:hypothetical protein
MEETAGGGTLAALLISGSPGPVGLVNFRAKTNAKIPGKPALCC